MHSRTFATAGQDGGVGVRVMVPVLDMFNHAGDEVRNLLTSRSRPCDNCRWQAVAPENTHVGEWVMQVRPLPPPESIPSSQRQRLNQPFRMTQEQPQCTVSPGAHSADATLCTYATCAWQACGRHRCCTADCDCLSKHVQSFSTSANPSPGPMYHLDAMLRCSPPVKVVQSAARFHRHCLALLHDRVC